MDKEPPELIEARSLLKKFEKSIVHRQGQIYLADILMCLDEVINGDFDGVYKIRANNMRETCWSMVLSNVNAFLDKKESFETGDISYWLEMVGSFGEEISKGIAPKLIVKYFTSMSKQEFQEFSDQVKAEQEAKDK
jgi:hypothetical protein